MTLSVPFSCCLFETDLLNVTVLMNFGSENVGMIMSIGQSVWSVLKENISLVMHSATALISVLTVGGNFIVNFLVNGVSTTFSISYFFMGSLEYPQPESYHD